MTKEELEKRIQILEANFDEAIAKANSINGALNECKLWLSKLNSEKNQDKSDKKLEEKTL